MGPQHSSRNFNNNNNEQKKERRDTVVNLLGDESMTSSNSRRERIPSMTHDRNEKQQANSGQLTCTTNNRHEGLSTTTSSFLMDQAMKHLGIDFNWAKNNLRKHIIKNVHSVILLADATIFSEGDMGTCMYVIEEGKVNLYASDGALLVQLNSGSIFGERSLLFDFPREYTAVCQEGCSLWKINREDFHSLQRAINCQGLSVHAKRLFEGVLEVKALPHDCVDRLIDTLAMETFESGEQLYTYNKGSTKVMVIEQGFVHIHFDSLLLRRSTEEIVRILGINANVVGCRGYSRPDPNLAYLLEGSSAKATREKNSSSGVVGNLNHYGTEALAIAEDQAMLSQWEVILNSPVTEMHAVGHDLPSQVITTGAYYTRPTTPVSRAPTSHASNNTSAIVQLSIDTILMGALDSTTPTRSPMATTKQSAEENQINSLRRASNAFAAETGDTSSSLRRASNAYVDSAISPSSGGSFRGGQVNNGVGVSNKDGLDNSTHRRQSSHNLSRRITPRNRTSAEDRNDSNADYLMSDGSGVDTHFPSNSGLLAGSSKGSSNPQYSTKGAFQATLNTIASMDDLQAMTAMTTHASPDIHGSVPAASGKSINGFSQRTRQDGLPAAAAYESYKQPRFSQREDSVTTSTRSPAGGGNNNRSSRQAPDPLSGRSRDGSPTQSRSGSRAGSRAASPSDTARSERSHRSNGDDYGPGPIQSEFGNTTTASMSSRNTDLIQVDSVTALIQRHISAATNSMKQRGQGTRISVSGATTAAATAVGAIAVSKSAPGSRSGSPLYQALLSSTSTHRASKGQITSVSTNNSPLGSPPRNNFISSAIAGAAALVNNNNQAGDGQSLSRSNTRVKRNTAPNSSSPSRGSLLDSAGKLFTRPMRKSAPDRASLSRTSLSSSSASPAVLSALKQVDSSTDNNSPPSSNASPERTSITRLSQSTSASSTAVMSALKRVNSGMKSPVLSALEMYTARDDTSRVDGTSHGEQLNNNPSLLQTTPSGPFSPKAATTHDNKTPSLTSSPSTHVVKTKVNYEVRAITTITGTTTAGSAALKVKPVVAVASECVQPTERPAKESILASQSLRSPVASSSTPQSQSQSGNNKGEHATRSFERDNSHRQAGERDVGDRSHRREGHKAGTEKEGGSVRINGSNTSRDRDNKEKGKDKNNTDLENTSSALTDRISNELQNQSGSNAAFNLPDDDELLTANQEDLPPMPVLVHTKDGKKYLRVGRGCVLGANVVPSLLRYSDAPEWKDEVDNGAPNVGCVSAITAVAVGEVMVTEFTSFAFEKVFGNASSALSLFENKELREYFDNLLVDGDAERSYGVDPSKGSGKRKTPRRYTRQSLFVNNRVTVLPDTTNSLSSGSISHRFSPSNGSSSGGSFSTGTGASPTPTPTTVSKFSHQMSINSASNTNTLYKLAASMAGFDKQPEKSDNNNSTTTSTTEPSSSSPTAIAASSSFSSSSSSLTGHAASSSESYGSSNSPTAQASGLGIGQGSVEKKKDVSKWNPAFLQMVGQMAVQQKKSFDPKSFTQILGIGTNRVGGLALAVLKDPNKKRTLTTNGMWTGGGGLNAIEEPGYKKPSLEYVLKIISKVKAVSEDEVDHVLEEAKILSSPISQHPFIAQLHGKFQTPDALVLVFRPQMCGDLWGVLYDKTTVKQVPRETRAKESFLFDGDEQIALDIARYYLASVCLALSHLHRHNIAHRNVKPENILLDEHGHVKLTGFSLAKRLPYTDSQGILLNKTFTVCGTAEYLAPEVILVYGHSMAVDAWALGVLACELLTGATPFASAGESTRIAQGKRRCVRTDQSEALIMAAIAETQTRGVRLPPGILAELSAVNGALEMVMGLLAPSPTARTLIPISLSPQQQSCLDNPPIAPSSGTFERRQSINGGPPSTHLLKNPFFFGFDWISLRQGVMPAPFIPSTVDLRALHTPTVGVDEAAALLRRQKEEEEAKQLAILTAKANQPVANYLAATTASRLGSVAVEPKVKVKTLEEEEAEEEERQQKLVDQQLFQYLTYSGDQSVFARFGKS